MAAQIEDVYESLIAEGLSDEEAWSELQRQIPDWKALGDELLEAEPVIVRLAQPERGPLAGAPSGRLCRRFARSWGSGLARDLQSSIRLLVKDRGFTATTILTLAVCLGANAAIFTVVYAVLLRPLPVPDSDRIVAMGDVYPTITPNDILSNTAPSYFDRLDAITTLEEQAMFALWFDTIAIDGISEEIRGMRATPSLFRVMQVTAALGRAFTDAEGEIGAEQQGHPEPRALAATLWRRSDGGRTRPSTGLDGAALHHRRRDAAWVLVLRPRRRRPRADTRRRGPVLDTARLHRGAEVGRLRAHAMAFSTSGGSGPDATIEQVQAQIDALNAANFERFPQFGLAELGMYTAVTPLQDALTRSVRGILYLLWGGAAFVLLIGAINIANLSLARSSVRARELATRLALGAGRFRVTRQLILEGVLLAGLGGLASVGVGAWILRTLVSSGMANMPNARVCPDGLDRRRLHRGGIGAGRRADRTACRRRPWTD